MNNYVKNTLYIKDLVGFILILGTCLLYDSSILKPLSAKGNVGVIFLLALAGCSFLVFPRIRLRSKVIIGRGQRIFVIICVAWVSYLLISFPLHGLDNVTLIGFFNVFSQLIIHLFIIKIIFSKINFAPVSVSAILGFIIYLIGLASYTIFPSLLNANWIAILGAIVIVFSNLSIKTKFDRYTFYLILVSIFLLNLFFLGSRGASVMVLGYFVAKFLARYSRFSLVYVFVPALIVITATSSFIGNQFYDTDLFWEINDQSKEYFNKRLAVTRFQRIVVTSEAAQSDVNIAVFGIGTSGFAIERFQELEASHNAFQDIIFFSGYLGWLIKLSFLFSVYSLLKDKTSKDTERIVLPVFVFLIIPANFYGILGFTHLAGTVPAYIILALMANYVQGRKMNLRLSSRRTV